MLTALRILVTAPAYALGYGLLGLFAGALEGALAAAYDARNASK